MIKGETEKRIKTQTLSLRLDPKVRYALEFAARARRQNITTVIETAILDLAGEHTRDGQDWTQFWDISEGIRELKYIFDSGHFRTSEEDLLKSFIEHHEEFFAPYPRAKVPICDRSNRAMVDILWPRIDEFVDTWEATKPQDIWAVGREMVEALSSAGLKAPDWPRKSGLPEPSKASPH